MESYLLAYCIKTVVNDKENITDHFEVFCEWGELEETPLELAEKRLSELEESFENSNTMELYTWNIAKIIQTSEHYETSVSPELIKKVSNLIDVLNEQLTEDALQNESISEAIQDVTNNLL